MKQYETVVVLCFMQLYFTTNGLHTWCSPYDTFCLFSEGNKVRVSSLSETQLKCSGIKNDSWPVELGDERVKEVFIEFINNHSISNVILNAFKRNGAWYWKKDNSTVLKNFGFRSSENILFHNNSEHQSVYAAVCMTGCHASWTDFSNSTIQNALHLPNIKTIDECKKHCDVNITCSSIDWVNAVQWHGCWTLWYPYDSSKMESAVNVSHHVINRSTKLVDRCIGKDSIIGRNWFETVYELIFKDLKIIPHLVAIIVILILVSFVVIVILCLVKSSRCFRPRNDEETSQDIRSSNTDRELNPSRPHGHLNPTGEDLYTEIGLNDSNPRDPYRYLDPTEDQYEEVNQLNPTDPMEHQYAKLKVPVQQAGSDGTFVVHPASPSKGEVSKWQTKKCFHVHFINKTPFINLLIERRI